jgi:glycosyltransferase involved in cell wall biosynthesis
MSAPGVAVTILHVVETLGSGGAERQLVNLIVGGLARDRFRHVVCYMRKPDFFAATIRDAGHDVICLNVEGRHPWVRAASRLRSVVRRYRPDLVHTRLYDPSVSTRLALMFRGHPQIVTSLESPDYDREVIRLAGWSPVKREILRWVDNLSARCAGVRFVACSNFVAKSGREALGIPRARIQVIYNSLRPAQVVSTAEAASRVRQELRLSSDAFVYANVGRLSPEKDHTTLFQAFARVAAAEPSAYLILVGGGPLEASLRALVDELELATRVRFLGVRDDVGSCLGAADAFVFPSLFEGQPVALLEAMFKGLPCVASRIPATLEVMEGAGLLVPPGSADELAAGMLQLLRNPGLRYSLGERARQEAMRRFHSDVVIPQWESLYLRLSRGGQFGTGPRAKEAL